MISLFNLVVITIFLLAGYIFYRGFKSVLNDIFKYFNKLKDLKSKKIIGIGGGGSNIVEYIYKESTFSFEPLVINSDKKALDIKKVPNKLYLSSPKNYGCGSNEACGLKLVDETAFKKIKNFISRSNKIYIIATLGGGVGSGSTKAIVKYLYEQKIDIYLIIVYPFSWEGVKKTKRADETLEFCKPYCKDIQIFKNDSLKKYYSHSMKECFNIMNRSIYKTIQDIK